MAVVNIENLKLKSNVAGVVPATVAVDAENGALVDYSNKSDGRILVVIENVGGGANTATIKSGNGLQGTEDLEISLEASEKKCIVVESGKFVNVYGDNAGKLVIMGADANIKVSAIELP